jgi:hypothetical protein
MDEEGSTDSTPDRASRRFSGVKASYRAGLVRVETQSRVPRLHTYVGLARCIRVGGALIRFLGHGFLGGLLLLIVGFGYS